MRLTRREFIKLVSGLAAAAGPHLTGLDKLELPEPEPGPEAPGTRHVPAKGATLSYFDEVTDEWVELEGASFDVSGSQFSGDDRKERFLGKLGNYSTTFIIRNMGWYSSVPAQLCLDLGSSRIRFTGIPTYSHGGVSEFEVVNMEMI
ncbi:MAG: hypothetical protein GF414_00520 [Candidatus Altiarchaeales archaeon]|nr:hypothetical protein [Candidatus Altiarchaeales archaeon]